MKVQKFFHDFQDSEITFLMTFKTRELDFLGHFAHCACKIRYHLCYATFSTTYVDTQPFRLNQAPRLIYVKGHKIMAGTA